MRYAILIFMSALLLSVSADARRYQGDIDFSSNNVSTSYEAVLTSPKKVLGFACQNTSSVEIWIGGGQKADCSDATDIWILMANGSQSFAYDDHEPPAQICAKTLTGTASSGVVNCISWLKEAGN